ncbi:hypothetical protein P3L10_030129 [Capsicum annuum]
MILNPMFGCYYNFFSPAGVSKRGHSPPLPLPPESKKASPPPRKVSPIPDSSVIHVDQLSRNVNENHFTEIFDNFDEIQHMQLTINQVVNLLKGFTYVEFKTRIDAEKAQLHMDGVWF